jgi:hypothetical protein
MIKIGCGSFTIIQKEIWKSFNLKVQMESYTHEVPTS